eukprot:4073801-Pyramimonas_sp.AAC.1
MGGYGGQAARPRPTPSVDARETCAAGQNEDPEVDAGCDERGGQGSAGETIVLPRRRPSFCCFVLPLLLLP